MEDLVSVDPPARGRTLEEALRTYADRVYPYQGAGDRLRELEIVGRTPGVGATLVRFRAGWDGANLDSGERDHHYTVLVRSAQADEYEVVAARYEQFGFR